MTSECGQQQDLKHNSSRIKNYFPKLSPDDVNRLEGLFYLACLLGRWQGKT